MKKYFLFIFLPVLTISLSGCFKKPSEKIIEKSIEKETGGQVQVDIDNDGSRVTYTDKESGTQVNIDTGGNLELPEEWPSDVKVYSNAGILSSTSGDDGVNLVLTTEDSPDEVVAWYDEEFADWEQVGAMNIGNSIMRTYDFGSKSFTVVVTTAEGQTMISNTFINNK